MKPLRVFGPDWVEDCEKWRGRLLTGDYSHWCADWDDLPIDETCDEWPCGCYEEEVKAIIEPVKE